MSEPKVIYCKSLLEAQRIIKDKKAQGDETHYVFSWQDGLAEALLSEKPDNDIDQGNIKTLKAVLKKRKDLIKRLLEE